MRKFYQGAISKVAQRRMLLMEEILKDIDYMGNGKQIGDREKVLELLAFYYNEVQAGGEKFNKIVIK